MTRRIPEVDWFIHGGGKRKNFKQRQSKTTFSIYFYSDAAGSIYFRENNKRRAVHKAVLLSKKFNSEVSVNGEKKTGTSLSVGFCEIICSENGDAMQIHWSHKHLDNVKYLRGYGKIIRSGKQLFK